MGRLVHTETGRRFDLTSNTFVGSGVTCLVRLEEDLVSEVHATLRWSNGQWTVRDMGSANGTWLEEEALVAGQSYAMCEGERLGFGRAELVWELVDDGPPGVLAVHEPTGRVQASRVGMLELPDSARAVAQVVLLGRKGWILEIDGDARPLERRVQTIVVDGEPWRLYLPEPVQNTVVGQTLRRLAQLVLLMSVDPDGRSSRYTLIGDDWRQSLPEHPRTHQLLAVLAQARRDDAQKRKPEDGWRDKTWLMDTLGATQGALDNWVFRCRRDFQDLGVVDAAQIIERPPGVGRMRLGPIKVVFDD